MEFSYFNIIAIVAIMTMGALLFVVLFEPGLQYRINVVLPPLNSDRFASLLAAVIDKPALGIAGCDVLTNGAEFYPAQLEAIRQAQTSVHLEVFIFHPTPIGKRFIAALEERAAAGVKVRVIVDAVGTMLTPNSFFDRLRNAGGTVVWYQPLRWYTLKRFNNRTHRNLLIIDGKTGFIGGAGIGAAWDTGKHGFPPWRDTTLRVDGPTAAALQSAFVENWLEASGEILADEADFPSSGRLASAGASGAKVGLVVASTPSAGRATRARTLFQLLVAAARTTICINSPYFMPDRAMRRELVNAAARGVEVTVIVPGKHNNHPLARRASRRHYGELLAAGIKIYEYEPGMIHAKILIADQLWSITGSTNFDNRSFGLNDEVNLAIRDPEIAGRLAIDFERDLQLSRRIEFEEWARRPIGERILAFLGMLFERHA
jgi:cardiolipin synthase